MPRKRIKQIDPMWTQLAKAEGITPDAIGTHSQALVTRKQPEVLPAPKPTRRREYQHPDPDDLPDTEDMILALSRYRGQDRGFGRHGFLSAWSVALSVETEVYNAWVRLQCLTRGLMSPGELSEKDYCDRYWVTLSGDDE